jgi:hypothetical protein
VACAIQILWIEHLLSTPYSTNALATQQQAAQAAANVGPTSYTLYVEP